MKKIMALVLAAAMLLACCSFAVAEDIPEEYPEIIEGLDFGALLSISMTGIPMDNGLKNPPMLSRLSMITGIGCRKLIMSFSMRIL